MPILAGYSPGGDTAAIELGAMLARSAGTDLVVITIVPAPWPTPLAEGVDRDFRQWAAEQGRHAVRATEVLLEQWCGDLEARAVWAHGRSISAGLLKEAATLGADLIVVGSAAHGPRGRVDVGSTADRLLHSSPIPVAVAPRGFRLTPPVDRVTRATVAFRGDPASTATLITSARYAAQVGAAVRVATFAVRGKAMYPPEVSGAEDMVQQQWAEQAVHAQQKALPTLAEQGLPTADVATELGIGADWGHALDAVAWSPGDVLVIGSSPTRLLERLFLGSSASRIVRESPVPVIVVQ